MIAAPVVTGNTLATIHWYGLASRGPLARRGATRRRVGGVATAPTARVRFNATGTVLLKAQFGGGAAPAGRRLGERTVAAISEGHFIAVAWAEQWPVRVFGLEDCRHLTLGCPAPLLCLEEMPHAVSGSAWQRRLDEFRRLTPTCFHA